MERILNSEINSISTMYIPVTMDLSNNMNITMNSATMSSNQIDLNISLLLNSTADTLVTEEEIGFNLQVFEVVNDIMDLYIKPIMYIFGIIGNVVSFAVFMFTYMRHISSSVYLAGLAISDTGFLLCALAMWTDNLDLHLSHKPVICQLIVYVSYITSFLSVWYIVSFTMERCIAIQFPLKRQVMCTPQRAKCMTVFLAVIAFVMYTFALWTSGLVPADESPGAADTQYCQTYPHYFNLVLTIGHADTIVTLIIPTILIVGSNIHIGYVLAKFYRSRTSIDHSFRLHCRGNTQSGSTPPQTSDDKDCFTLRSRQSSVIYANTSYNRSQMKVTRMLLIVSSTFLILNTPMHMLRLVVFYSAMADANYDPPKIVHLCNDLFTFMYYLNFCVNFLLYAVSGRTFRRALSRLVTRIRRGILQYCQKARMRFRKNSEIEIQEQSPLRRDDRPPLARRNTKVEYINVADKHKVQMCPRYD